MKQKWFIVPYSITHFLVDFACAIFMYHFIGGTRYWYISMLLYNFCAFAMQMPFGLLVDRVNKNALFAGLGCFLVAAAYLMKAFPISAVLIVGIGNAFFHVGAGTDVLNSSKKASLLGIFVSPGVFGIYYGTMYGVRDLLIIKWFPVILLSIGIVLIFMDFIADKSLSSHNRQISFESIKNPDAVLATVCFFIIVVVRSYLGFKKFTWGADAHWGTFLICAVVFGKAMGGILSDWFGIKKVAFLSLAASTIMFVCSNNPVCGVLAILFFNMTMPITLWAIAKIMSGVKGFSFGMLTLALFVGFLFTYFSNQISYHSPVATALLALISLAVMMLGMKKGVE